MCVAESLNVELVARGIRDFDQGTRSAVVEWNAIKLLGELIVFEVLVSKRSGGVEKTKFFYQGKLRQSEGQGLRTTASLSFRLRWALSTCVKPNFCLWNNKLGTPAETSIFDTALVHIMKLEKLAVKKSHFLERYLKIMPAMPKSCSLLHARFQVILQIRKMTHKAVINIVKQCL